ncbi:D-inositol 3-phosphate glycosyltransferase [compost metagenome]
MTQKLAIVVTHPIQYYVPVFKLLAKQCNLKVFYTWGENGVQKKYDPGFAKTIGWDVPLLDDYHYELLENTAKDQGSHHGKGIINPDILTRIKKFSPNAILVYGYIYHSHFKVMSYFKGKIPIWFRGDSTLLNEKTGLKSILKKIYLRWVYSKVDKAFYVGTNSKAYFKKYGLKEHQLIFAPHAIDNNHFSQNRSAEVQEIKVKLGYTPEDIILLYAGKFESLKNIEILIQAVEKINDDKLKLLLVGNGPEEQKLKAQAINQKNISFLDFQNQQYLPVIYSACDIFCLPSYSETWGLAINEAMAASRAIIVSDKVGCAVDLVKPNENGVIFKSNSAIALSEAIEEIISSKRVVDYGKMSSAIINQWTFKKQVNALINELGKTN